MARAGGAVSGAAAVDEPLAEWERELLAVAEAPVEAVVVEAPVEAVVVEAPVEAVVVTDVVEPPTDVVVEAVVETDAPE
jgi:small subunit ribosomal protein S2